MGYNEWRAAIGAALRDCGADPTAVAAIAEHLWKRWYIGARSHDEVVALADAAAHNIAVTSGRRRLAARRNRGGRA